MRFCLAAIALVLGVESTGAAGTYQYGVSGGISSPSGDFSDVVDMGFHGAAAGNYMVSDVLGVGVDLGYQSWNATDKWNAASDAVLSILTGTTVTGSEWKFRVMQFSGHLLANIPVQGNVKPWLKGGLGFYNIGLKLDAPGYPSDSDSKSKFGFNVGGGVGFAVNPNVTLGVGAAYHIVPAQDYIDMDLNMLTAGVNATFGPSGN